MRSPLLLMTLLSGALSSAAWAAPASPASTLTAAPHSAATATSTAASTATSTATSTAASPAAPAPPPAPTAGITWAGDYDQALATAALQGQLVFVAVNRDGEAGNDRMAEDVYDDRALQKLAAQSVNLIASDGEHGRGSTCSRFGSLSCEEHQTVDAIVVTALLGATGEQEFISPHHLFLRPDGTLILSVAYEVTALELAWCFDAAWRALDPEHIDRAPSGARPPRRLITGDVTRPGENTPPQPISRDEALALIDAIQRDRAGKDRERNILQLLTSPEKEAMECVLTELRSDVGGGRGKAVGRQGKDRSANQKTEKLVRAIGQGSPPEYWEVLAEFTEDGSDTVRAEVAVALEQLAAPKSLKAIAAALRAEELPAVEKDWLRALGAAGASDKGATKTLMKAATKEKDELLRVNALLALGSLTPGDDRDEVLADALTGEHQGQRAAAACAVALTRDPRWKQPLQDLIDDVTTSDDTRTAAEAALKVIEGGALSLLAGPVAAACQDTIPRKRIFGG